CNPLEVEAVMEEQRPFREVAYIGAYQSDVNYEGETII
ncbi:Hypothetical predicted protein, partial [Paramuricea clavata]